MTPLEVLEAATKEQLSDRSGEAASVRLLPPATEDELEAVQRLVKNRLPLELRQLLDVTSGFEFAPVGTLDLLGRGMTVETFFRSLPVLEDDSGNFWILDLEGGAEKPASVIFWCHDPPVAVMQAPTLAAFLQQIFALGRPLHDDALTFVKRTCAHRIWAKDPFLIPAAKARDLPTKSSRVSRSPCRPPTIWPISAAAKRGWVSPGGSPRPTCGEQAPP